MVGYNQAYHGSDHVKFISKNGKIVKKVYKGSELVYQVGFDTFTVNAGTTNQAWTVPYGVEKIHVDCVASKGANGSKSNGGNGGRVQCDMDVTGGETLYLTVGAIPSNQNTASYNASDIRKGGTAYSNRILVAGGGGSGVSSSGDDSRTYVSAGAVGGGTTGGSSATVSHRATAQGATGGTQTAGGTGSHDGTFGLGGDGGNYWGTSGGGGAGWYGGGGGNSAAAQHSGDRYRAHSGGGGGSSYANTSYCSNVVHTQGYRNGAGYMTISYVW